MVHPTEQGTSGSGTCSGEKWRGWREGQSRAEDDHNGKRSDNGSEHVNTALEQPHKQYSPAVTRSSSTGQKWLKEKEQADHQDIHSSKSADNTTHQQDPVGRQEPMGHYWSHWRGLLPYPTTEWREGTSDAGQQYSQGVWTYTNCSVRLTTTSRRPSGARTSTVNTVDTTAGGHFSGSLKRCCRHTKRRRGT